MSELDESLYCGKQLKDMSRDELYKAIINLARLYKRSLQRGIYYDFYDRQDS
jgi:hypothetical protein